MELEWVKKNLPGSLNAKREMSRPELILTLLRQSGKMRSTNIASELGCSLKTDKRELDTLRFAGHIEFVGPSKTGTHRLVGA